MLFYYSETRKVGDERAIRLRNPDAYELHSVARSPIDCTNLVTHFLREALDLLTRNN